MSFTAGGKEQELQADKVLIGIGFEANVEGLGWTRSASRSNAAVCKTDDR